MRHHHVGGIHLTGVGDLQRKAHQARLLEHLGAVGGRGHREGQRILRRHGRHRKRLGHHRHLGAALVRGGHGELVFRRGGNGDFLFQRQAFAGLELLVGKHVAQGRVGHAQVAVIHAAGILQLQRKGDGAVFHHTLDVAGQLGRQRGFAIGDGLVFNGIGLGFAFGFGLVGDSGPAGQVLFAHGDGIAHLGGLARLQQRNGLLFLVDIGVFLDGHVREVDGAAVGDVIAHHHLLILTGHGGADGAFDLDIGFSRLQRNGRSNGLALVHGLAAVLIEGIFDKVNHSPVFQGAVVDVVGTGPGGAFARLEQHRAVGAEIGHDLRRGIVKHDRVLHIGIA